ncbi:glycosyltransferase family 39 protein [Candidatus Gottesmanbacteria bacterium]|nr:glycosyltransferase family 39 protein [Candidatus Gottesmanbacteria bacterium]
MMNKNRFFLFTLIFLTLIVRVVKLDTIPPNINPDEADNMRVILRIVSGKGPSFFGFDWKPAPAFSMYMYLPIYLLMGYSYIGIRITSVLVTTICVVLFFKLLQKYFSIHIAFLSSLLLATNYWFLNFSRSGWENSFISLLLVSALILINKSQSRYFVFALGCIAALGFYGYFTGLLILPAIIIVYLLKFLIEQKKRYIANIVIITIIYLVLISPMLYSVLTSKDLYFRRMRAVSQDVKNESIYLPQIKKVLSSFFMLDSKYNNIGINARYSSPTHPFINDKLVPFLIIGFVIGCLHFKKYLPFIIFYILLIFPIQIITKGTPDGARAVAAAPLYFVFVGLGFSIIPRHSKVILILLYIFVFFVAIDDLKIYTSWINSAKTLEIRQPVLETEDYDNWREAQFFVIKNINNQGFTVDDWNKIKKDLHKSSN